MRRSTIATILAGVAVGFAFAGTAWAEARSEMGKQEYESNCVACHGASGKGDGYFAQYLKLPIPDLTTIQQRNKGVFPTDRIIEIIDGRQALKGHGPRNMPIWGTAYTEKVSTYYRGHAYDAEQFIRVRVLALRDYLYTKFGQCIFYCGTDVAGSSCHQGTHGPRDSSILLRIS